MKESIKTTVLRCGATEATALVSTTMMSLKLLLETEPIAFFELVEIAKDRTHQPFGNTGRVLRDVMLLDARNGMHSSIRHVVLSAVHGEGFNLTLGNPV